jgi:4-hydroxybenzoate polyprenyltransferase
MSTEHVSEENPVQSTLSYASVKMRGVIRLTRWKEYVTWVFPLTAFGALLSGKPMDFRLLLVMLANTLVVAYAFMINDVEDAPDDAREAHRAAKNPITNGELTPLQGWAVSMLAAVATMVLFWLAGTQVFIVGMITLVLSHLYSWKPIRLKAFPVVDVVSHSLMLSGLLFLAGYYAYDSNPGPVWLVALVVTLISVYGQLYNQLRDFDMDVQAGLKNTAITIGKRNAQMLMYGSVGLAVVLFFVAVALQVVPLWVLVVPLIGIPALAFFTRPSATDSRGTKAVDFSGSIQTQALLVLNATVAVWLVVSIIGAIR